MAQCAYCKTETRLYDGGVPICLECADARDAKSKPLETERRIRTTLMKALTEATARSHAASDAFSDVMGRNIPSGLPQPDGTQRIHNVSRELSAAREEVTKAHTRLNEFLSRGIIPEDLKQGSGR
jgi:hypothetical protein